MRDISRYLDVLKKLEKREHHPYIHELHKKYGISKKTLFYVKEYGSHANVIKTILRESLKVLLFASVLSSLGGLALEYIKPLFLSIIPLIVLLPALNDMIGDYGSIVSSRFSTMLHEGCLKKRHWIYEVRTLLFQVITIAVFTAILSSVISLVASHFSSYSAGIDVVLKVVLISVIDTVVLVSLLFLVAIFGGLYFFSKKEDPNNFLIPITTSVADFGNMVILALLVLLFF